MQKPKIPEGEADRIAALKSYNILDTLPETDFDNITLIAAQICDTPISLVSLIDEDRQWFKSRHGLSAEQTPRELAFCAHAINDPEHILLVEDSHKDDRFADNPLVTNDPNVRFYAGAPLINPEGHPLGTLCVIDHKPRALTLEQLEALDALSSQVISQLELRKKMSLLDQKQRELENALDDLSQFAYIASHDLKTPLRGLLSVIEWIEADCTNDTSEKMREYLNLLKNRGQMMTSMVDGILEYSKTTSREFELNQSVDMLKVFSTVKQLVQLPENCSLTFPELDALTVRGNETIYTQVLQNLISNAIQYNDKDICKISVTYELRNDSHCFDVSDNGPGIPEKYRQKIFEIFQTLAAENRFGERGTGIGLATVKRLIEKMNGTVQVADSDIGGARMTIVLPVH